MRNGNTKMEGVRVATLRCGNIKPLKMRKERWKCCHHLACLELLRRRPCSVLCCRGRKGLGALYLPSPASCPAEMSMHQTPPEGTGDHITMAVKIVLKEMNTSDSETQMLCSGSIE